MSTSKQRDSSRQSAARPAGRQDARSRAQFQQAGFSAKSTRDDRSGSASDDASFTRLHDLVMAALDDMKARDVHEVDVRGRSDVTDMLVVASGTSSRHVRSIAEEVVAKGKQVGLPPLGVEGEDEGDWVLVDMGDIVVHVMQPRTREFYGLERLWGVGDEAPGESVSAS